VDLVELALHPTPQGKNKNGDYSQAQAPSQAQECSPLIVKNKIF
jgi:hypothetical protein